MVKDNSKDNSTEEESYKPGFQLDRDRIQERIFKYRVVLRREGGTWMRRYFQELSDAEEYMITKRFEYPNLLGMRLIQNVGSPSEKGLTTLSTGGTTLHSYGEV